ncbi:hypothetical protein H0H93_008977 [Arthromyces matolae]|nr:hypothetical protein H0H93_008977 [Arthromyces matolae]
MVASNRLAKGLLLLLGTATVKANTHSSGSALTVDTPTSSASSTRSDTAVSSQSSLSISLPSSSASVTVSSASFSSSQASASSGSASQTVSSSAPASSKASTSVSATSSSPSTISAPNQVPISSNTFSPFPTPSQSPVPNVYPKFDPSNPPSVNSPLIPDFNPAWAAAYEKAKDKVSGFTLDEKISTATGVGWMNGLCVVRQFLLTKHKRTQESSDVDDRTQHEIYAHPFLKSIMAGVASLMCSYNLVNGTYACENNKIMNDIIKREYGFQGFIMSDWQATPSTISVNTGLDMTMPGDITFDSGTTYFGANITAYVNNGTIPESRVDDMATRILAAWYLLHQDDPSYPTTNFNAFQPDDESTNQHIDVQDDHYKIVREIGAASIVLLKNENDALPLNKPRSILLAGSDAGPGKIGPNEFADQGGQDGILAMGWGSGTANFTYLISPYEAIQARARKDRTSVSWIFDDFNLPRAGNMAIGKSAAIVFINSDSGEDYITVDGNEGDRKNLTAWHGGDNLVLAVAAQNKNTIVVVHSVGPLIIEPWIEHPNVTAVLWAGLPGTEAGNAITDVLYGDWNPSGRLPYTIAKQSSDYPAQLVTGGSASAILDIPYTEGLEIDYRHFDAKNITPRFEFGFGLSYTTYSYSGLKVSTISETDNTQADLISAWNAGKASPISEGSSAALWPAYSVSFSVKNTGSLYGGEIPQLYLNMPASAGEPPSILRGFTHVELQPGESKTVTINLSRYDLSIWDVVAQGWRKPSGTIKFTVGASSRDGRLHGKIPGSSHS